MLDHVSVEIVGDSFLGSARKVHEGWEAKTVLVDHEWLRTSRDG
jgi:hypothetical protein